MDIEKQLREIARDKRYWEEKRERIRLTDRKVEELEQNYREQLAAIKEERKAILRDAKVKAKELMAEANRQIETTIKSIRESQADKEQTKLLRRSFNEFKDNVEQDNAMQAEYDERLEREMARLERRMERRNERKNKGPKTESVVEQPAVKRLPLAFPY